MPNGVLAGSLKRGSILNELQLPATKSFFQRLNRLPAPQHRRRRQALFPHHEAALQTAHHPRCASINDRSTAFIRDKCPLPCPRNHSSTSLSTRRCTDVFPAGGITTRASRQNSASTACTGASARVPLPRTARREDNSSSEYRRVSPSSVIIHSPCADDPPDRSAPCINDKEEIALDGAKRPKPPLAISLAAILRLHDRTSENQRRILKVDAMHSEVASTLCLVPFKVQRLCTHLCTRSSQIPGWVRHRLRKRPASRARQTTRPRFNPRNAANPTPPTNSGRCRSSHSSPSPITVTTTASPGSITQSRRDTRLARRAASANEYSAYTASADASATPAKTKDVPETPTRPIRISPQQRPTRAMQEAPAP
jgi:hypothetical protein